MILADTGPIVAILDRRDGRHAACVAALNELPDEPMATTWSCFTEAMYLLGATGGHSYQSELWRLRASGKLALIDLTSTEINRVATLMAKYHDLPMDLADATLVALAESRGWRRIFTIDSDFHIYQLANGSTLDVIP